MPAAPQQHTISVSIPRSSVASLENSLSHEFPEAIVELEKQRPALLGNQPLRQVEIVNLLIHAGTVVALEEILRFLKGQFANLVIKRHTKPSDGDGE